jgi:hypothetical protein
MSTSSPKPNARPMKIPSAARYQPGASSFSRNVRGGGFRPCGADGASRVRSTVSVAIVPP